jgi:ABC-type Fe3+ transport system permease subunit
MQEVNVHSPLEQFALPHQFTPRLSLFGACVAIAGAMARILIGSLIGALWGVRIWLAVASNHSIVWKSLVVSLLAAGLAASLTALMWAVQKATMKLDPCATSSSAPPVI